MTIRDDRRESPDIDAGTIVALMIGFVASAVVASALIWLYYRDSPAAKVAWRLADFPAPRLETHTGQALAALRTGEANDRSNPGSNQSIGASRSAIDQAMDAIAKRGAAAYGPPAANGSAGP
jgi:hypothetical protein